MSKCKSCGHEIEWARTAPKGQWMPIDPEPVPGGNLSVDRSRWPPVARVLKEGEGSRQLSLEGGDELGEVLGLVSHFSTCRDAKEWRKN